MTRGAHCDTGGSRCDAGGGRCQAGGHAVTHTGVSGVGDLGFCLIAEKSLKYFLNMLDTQFPAL